MTDVSAAVRDTQAKAADRLRVSGWMLVQQALAATVAWILATHVVHHRQPFFAPMAAVVALNAPLGQRGGNTLRLLEGVVIGIVAGEFGLGTLGATSGVLFLATLAAMVGARICGGSPLALAQAATAAILTITTGDAHVGPDRLIDALIGGSVALVFSQILFAPEPVRLLRREESRALNLVADAFELAARAVDDDDDDLAGQAIDKLRDLGRLLSELGQTREASQHVADRSAVWRSQRAPVVEEKENAGQLDLLGGSAMMVIRNATAADGDDRKVLSPAIHSLGAEVRDLARDPGDQAVRQRAADRVLACVRQLQSDDRVQAAAPSSALAATVDAIRTAAVDIMVFAGGDADQARQAVQRDDAGVDVHTPARRRTMSLTGAWQSWKRAARSRVGGEPH